MSARTNENEQPVSGFINADRRLDRDIAEMLGLAKGVLADGVVSPEEAILLKDWVSAHPDVVEAWPGNVLAERLDKIFEDGIVDQEEQEDLAELLSSIVGEGLGLIGGVSSSTSLPLDSPPPTVEYDGATFLLTGKFAMGPRKECERLIQEKGGKCGKLVTKKIDYLVVGTFGSRDWIQSSHGRKIEKAVAYREKGYSLAIINENHWAASLD